MIDRREFAYETEQDVEVTQRNENSQAELRICVKYKINGKKENNMFIDSVGKERNIHAWVLQNATTVFKRDGVFVDSEIRYTWIKFILGTFPSCCDGCSFFRSDEKQLIQ